MQNQISYFHSPDNDTVWPIDKNSGCRNIYDAAYAVAVSSIILRGWPRIVGSLTCGIASDPVQTISSSPERGEAEVVVSLIVFPIFVVVQFPHEVWAESDSDAKLIGVLTFRTWAAKFLCRVVHSPFHEGFREELPN